MRRITLGLIALLLVVPASVPTSTAVADPPVAVGTVSMTEFALPAGAVAPFGIAAGSRNSVWFGAGDYVGQVTERGRVLTYRVPTPNALVGWVTRGPDGAMWFAERGGNKIGRIDARGRIREISLPTPDSVPQAIVFDRRGRLWYTASEVHKLGRIDRNGAITEFPVPTAEAFPLGMTLGPDNALWFTERSAGQIGRFDLRTETITEYPLATGANPQRIVLGNDGALWFTDFLRSRIGRITTSGQITEYPVPSQPVGLAADRGGIWYAGYLTARIGRVAYDGSFIAEYQVPTPNSRPIQITLGSGRGTNVWFTEQGADQIGRLHIGGKR